MIMNNNDNKKSVGQWVHRLFKQSGTVKTLTTTKSYFAHHYHADHNELDKIPFRSVFADEGKNQFNFVAHNTDFQQVFEHELSILNEKNRLSHASKDDGQNSSTATEDSLCHNNLGDQYIILNGYNETLDTKTFHLAQPNGQVIDYLPGQYVTISLVIEGQEYKRSYSLASTPTRPGSLEITVKRDPNGGVVSNWLNDHLKEGDTLTIKGPFGNFSCANDKPSRILFLAAGSGIVPIMSMLRWLIATNAGVDIVLLLSFRTQYDIIFADELKMIAARYKNIKLFITLTKEPLIYSQWAGLTGRINEQMIANCLPDVSERVVYQCGPEAFMMENKQYLQNLALPVGHLFCESFTVNGQQAPEQAKKQNSIIGRPSRNQTGSYRIRFAKSGKTIAADGSLTLLELAENSGVNLANECRAGNCGECMVKCRKGNIEMTDQAEIDESDRKKGWVYACCSYPVSNVVLEA
jgi:glycine betaine catabolism B